MLTKTIACCRRTDILRSYTVSRACVRHRSALFLRLFFSQTVYSNENRFSQSVTFDTQRMKDGSRGTLL